MENNKNKTLAISLLCFISLLPAAHAEISGSGSPNSGCQGQLTGLLWHDLNADGVADAGEPGLSEVSMQLVYDEDSTAISATTNAAGYYQFNYLCGGDYLAVIDETTVPEGLLDSDPGTDLGGWLVELDNEQDLVLNRGYAGCDVTVNATCTVASLASELYRCEKPIDRLSLVWNGSQSIRVVAHEGKDDDPVLADIDDIARGDRVTVTGIAGSPDDVIWEIFAAGTSTKLGESKFRVNCDDEEMDGPEDCGLPQGDGKDNKAEYINDWLLDGIVDDSGLLECTHSTTASKTCELQSAWADCELVDKVNWLTFSYTGGGCSASVNDQPEEFECEGAVDANDAVTVLTESGDSFPVRPGATFTIPTAGSDTDVELTNSQGTEALRIKTSCSEPLAAGDVYGSLTLLALNGMGIGGQIDFGYELHNKRNLAVVANTVEAPFKTLHQAAVAIEPLTTKRVAGSAYVTETTTSALLTQLPVDINPLCNGADFVGVIVAPRAPCEISGSGLQFHDHDILWNLGAGAHVGATIDRIEVSWPESVADKLKEIKLDGEKIFDQDSLGGAVVIDKADLVGDLPKRHISRNESKELKIVFDDDIESASIDDFEIEVHFKQGCVANW